MIRQSGFQTLALCLLLSGGAAAWAHAPAGASPEQTPPAPSTTTSDLVDGPDALIASRLESIFASLNGLSDLEIEVRSGVVILGGSVLGTVQEDRAIAIAESLDGVITVETNIRIERDIRRRLTPVMEDLRDRVLGWLAMLPTLVVAMILAVFFWWLGRFLAAHEFLTRRWAPNGFVADFLKLILHGAVFIFGLVLALEIIGASAFLGSILGALGLAGLAVGIAVRDTVENFIASLLLSVRQPFAPQDYVRIDGHEGRVARLTSRATILMNPEGNHVRIPNSTVYKGTLINYTRNPNRRFNFEVGIANDTDIAAAQAVALDAIRAIPGVLDDPGPGCVVQALGDSNVLLNILGWIDQSQSALGKTRGAAIVAVKQSFETAGIGMPEPSYIINTRSEEATSSFRGETSTGKVAKASVSTLVQADLAPNHDLERQLDRDLGGQDLLDAEAPRE